ncbi:hypothetical protein PCANC_00634 [Puccinia coronata f. sp. avenae]|uniref:Uncharacterized protein n=1 Tax=Puccinia coronata f. sp. avenae TaxID=200324 RepID=A0A2N5W6Z6_9BASI|nr:hypothetical protein PCANC_00634 [Puccinia coronata f. sp. avenae]
MESGRERGRLIRELSGREVHNLLLDELVRIPLWPRLNEPNYDEFIADAVNQASSDHDTALP